jgi:tetratricopeptide (TPR) repeat protein
VAGATALALFQAQLGADDPLVIASKTNLGLYLCPTGELVRAEALLREAVDAARRTLPRSKELGQALHNLALLYRNNARWGEAEATYADAVEVLRAVDGAAVTVTLRDQAIMWVQRGDPARARAAFATAEAEVRARLDAAAQPSVLAQLAQDLALLDADPATTTPTTTAAKGDPGSGAGGDAGGRVRTSAMQR